MRYIRSVDKREEIEEIEMSGQLRESLVRIDMTVQVIPKVEREGEV